MKDRLIPEQTMRGGKDVGQVFLGAVVAAVIGIGVTIPVVLQAVQDSNMGGTTETIVELVPLFVAILFLVSLARPIMRRM